MDLKRLIAKWAKQKTNREQRTVSGGDAAPVGSEMRTHKLNREDPAQTQVNQLRVELEKAAVLLSARPGVRREKRE